MMKKILLVALFAVALCAQDKPPTSGQTITGEGATIMGATTNIIPKCPTHNRNDDGHATGGFQENGKIVFTFCTKEYNEVQFRVLEQNGLVIYRSK